MEDTPAASLTASAEDTLPIGSSFIGSSATQGSGYGRPEEDGKLNLYAMRQFYQQVVTECAFPELLGSWTKHPRGVDLNSVAHLLKAWGETQKLLRECKVTLEPVEAVKYLINEKAELRMLRMLQVYQLQRLRKILADPFNVLEVQASNPNTPLLEDNERDLADQWKSYITDHNWDLPEPSPEYAHILSAAGPLPLPQWLRLLEGAQEEDPAIAAIQHDLSTVASPDVPEHTSVCFSSDAFRLGLYKGKLQARM